MENTQIQMESIKQEQTDLNWLNEEQKEIEKHNLKQFDNLPSLKLEENKVYEFEIDFSKPFEKWQDPSSGAVKKIIPVTYNDTKMNFWLNCANPVYSKIISLGSKGQKKFKVIRIGQANATRYNLIE